MSVWIWILIGAVLLSVLSGNRRNTGKSVDRPVRIDHPHLLSEDESECSVCGSRFKGKGMDCPHCGARFAGVREDSEEFDEEEDEMEAWDEEEER